MVWSHGPLGTSISRRKGAMTSLCQAHLYSRAEDQRHLSAQPCGEIRDTYSPGPCTWQRRE